MEFIQQVKQYPRISELWHKEKNLKRITNEHLLIQLLQEDEGKFSFWMDRIEKYLSVLWNEPKVQEFSVTLAEPPRFESTLAELEISAFFKKNFTELELFPQVNRNELDFKVKIKGRWIFAEIKHTDFISQPWKKGFCGSVDATGKKIREIIIEETKHVRELSDDIPLLLIIDTSEAHEELLMSALAGELCYSWEENERGDTIREGSTFKKENAVSSYQEGTKKFSAVLLCKRIEIQNDNWRAEGVSCNNPLAKNPLTQEEVNALRQVGFRITELK